VTRRRREAQLARHGPTRPGRLYKGHCRLANDTKLRMDLELPYGEKVGQCECIDTCAASKRQRFFPQSSAARVLQHFWRMHCSCRTIHALVKGALEHGMTSAEVKRIRWLTSISIDPNSYAALPISSDTLATFFSCKCLKIVIRPFVGVCELELLLTFMFRTTALSSWLFSCEKNQPSPSARRACNAFIGSLFYFMEIKSRQRRR
jgi:hypothetical protein